ncbi:hypothetical protein HETIRDRAFT_461406 [Heterobasidion irregulare TC 32-1]|uniref:Uncharacterized protein n=1 Tax=Heterobasidion irregulare (strain TC 32-1) TaxID=747525 RepID=W4JNM3_HETIT|nr:uncharacterized protein HETIRDRAFT_461406 [Heterobasidion irregulare TC 32-1]ETW74665.1 hypothetical protein HETIRDRAFT_461406 [Heterobasidion irregulare TC 32-1]
MSHFTPAVTLVWSLLSALVRPSLPPPHLAYALIDGWMDAPTDGRSASGASVRPSVRPRRALSPARYANADSRDASFALFVRVRSPAIRLRPRPRRWSYSTNSGAFKRLMTPSPPVSCSSDASSSPHRPAPPTGLHASHPARPRARTIKYAEGWALVPGVGVIPLPYEEWTRAHRRAIFPLTLCLSFAWALELCVAPSSYAPSYAPCDVTHLEELCFWLFVLNAGRAQDAAAPSQRHGGVWFQSAHFRAWALGSLAALVYLPAVTGVMRRDALKCEAYTFLVGSLSSLALTISFLPILWAFPPFLRNLRNEGVEMPTIVRLTKFHEYNTIRVLFRFLFAVPIAVLGVDGVRPHQHINDNMFGTEILAIAAGFGLVISSGLTLVIFFPRSIEAEIAARDHSTNTGTGTGVGIISSARTRTRSRSLFRSDPSHPARPSLAPRQHRHRHRHRRQPSSAIDSELDSEPDSGSGSGSGSGSDDADDGDDGAPRSPLSISLAAKHADPYQQFPTLEYGRAPHPLAMPSEPPSVLLYRAAPSLAPSTVAFNVAPTPAPTPPVGAVGPTTRLQPNRRLVDVDVDVDGAEGAAGAGIGWGRARGAEGAEGAGDIEMGRVGAGGLTVRNLAHHDARAGRAGREDGRRRPRVFLQFRSPIDFRGSGKSSRSS